MGLFGDTLSENIVNVGASLVANVIMTTVQDAGDRISLKNDASLKKGCSISNSLIKQKNAVKISKTVVSNIKTSAKLKQSLDVTVKQMAEAVAQNLSLRMGDIEAKNKIDLFARMAQNVKVMVEQGCFTNSEAENKFSCDEKASADGIVIDQDNFVDVVKQCVLNQIASADLQQEFAAAFDQSASAIEKNALAWIALIIGAVIAVVVFLISGGKTIVKRLTNWKFVLAVTPVLSFCIYLIIAKLSGRWPWGGQALVDPKDNDNIVKIFYPRKELIKPIDYCRANGFPSIQFIEKLESDVIEGSDKKMYVKSFDINTETSEFYMYCRRKPLPGKCEDDGFQCPDILQLCCSSSDNCDEYGLCTDL